MTSKTQDQLRDRAIDWIVPSIIGAALSVVFSILIVPKESIVQLLIISVFLTTVLCGLIYFMILTARYKRLLDRLGIVKVLNRDGNLECDLPTSCRYSYKYLGMSAVHALTDICASKITNSRRARTLEIMHLDPTCEAAVRSIAEIEEREPSETKDLIKAMIKEAEKINRNNCPSYVRLIPHSLIPSFRVSILDDDQMYVGEYSLKSFGYFSDLIVLKNMDDRPSLYSMFQNYYERTREFAIFHQVSRTLIPIKFKWPQLSLSELLEKVSTELRGTPVENLITIQMIEDALHEFHLDNPIPQKDG